MPAVGSEARRIARDVGRRDRLHPRRLHALHVVEVEGDAAGRGVVAGHARHALHGEQIAEAAGVVEERADVAPFSSVAPSIQSRVVPLSATGDRTSSRVSDRSASPGVGGHTTRVIVAVWGVLGHR